MVTLQFFCSTKYNRIQPKHKQTKSEHSRRKSYGLQLSQYSTKSKNDFKWRYQIRHWIPMFIVTPCRIPLWMKCATLLKWREPWNYVYCSFNENMSTHLLILFWSVTTSPLLPTKEVWKLKMMSMKKIMSTTESSTTIRTELMSTELLLDISLITQNKKRDWLFAPDSYFLISVYFQRKLWIFYILFRETFSLKFAIFPFFQFSML